MASSVLINCFLRATAITEGKGRLSLPLEATLPLRTPEGSRRKLVERGRHSVWPV